MADDQDGVGVAELVTSLSYAADLGLGQPLSHCIRQTVIALRLAQLHVCRMFSDHCGLLVTQLAVKV